MGLQWHLAHNVIKHIFVIGPLTGSKRMQSTPILCFFFSSSSWLLSKQEKKGSSSCFDLSIVFYAFAFEQSIGLSQAKSTQTHIIHTQQKEKRRNKIKASNHCQLHQRKIILRFFFVFKFIPSKGSRSSNIMEIRKTNQQKESAEKNMKL